MLGFIIIIVGLIMFLLAGGTIKIVKFDNLGNYRIPIVSIAIIGFCLVLFGGIELKGSFELYFREMLFSI